MKIALINFYIRQDEYSNRYYLSTMRLAEYLMSFGYDVDLIAHDLNDYTNFNCVEIIAKKYDLIGLSCFFWTKNAIQYTSKKLQYLDSNLNIVVGGPEIDNVNLEEWDNEIFIVGEGEEALLNVCKYVKNGKTDLEFFDNHDNIFNKENPRNSKIISNLQYYNPLFTNLNIPDRDFLWYETCRGCDYNCGYCGHKTRNKTAYFDLQTIEQEIINIGEMEFKEVFVIDPNFGGNKNRAKKILRLFEKYAPNTKIGLYFRPEFIDEETIECLSEANIDHVRIGIQTTNKDVPKWIRSNSLYHVEKCLPELSKNNINWRGELIVGLPNDNFEGLKNSIDFMEDLNPTDYACYHLTLIPNTPMYRLVDNFKEDMWVTIDENSRVYSSNSFDNDELKEMLDYSKTRIRTYNSKM